MALRICSVAPISVFLLVAMTFITVGMSNADDVIRYENGPGLTGNLSKDRVRYGRQVRFTNRRPK